MTAQPGSAPRGKVLGSLLLSVVVLTASMVVLSVAPADAATSPALGGIASFSVLAGTTVTCTGATTTGGDVGVSPGTSITGFPPCLAGTSGTAVHSNDALAIAARASATAIYTSIDQPCDFSFGSQDLTLLTQPLVAGVYCATSDFSISGSLTLSSGVFIFKAASTLVTASGSTVTGGDPCNVWWRINSSATLAGNMIGNVMALASISMNTGATLNGRALAGAGVTLQANTISNPPCGPAGGTSTAVDATGESGTTSVARFTG